MITRAILTRSAMRPALGWMLAVVLPPLLVSPSWGAVATDRIISGDSSSPATSISTPAFSTTTANELLLAFVSADATSSGMSVTGVTGANLTWTLVQRTNAQLGTAEIWRAFARSTLSSVTVRASLSQSVAASITLVSFTGTDTSGTNGAGAIGAVASRNANSGAPSATLVTTRNNSWVWGVGTDYDNPIARTLGPNQFVVHFYLPTVGDTYWVQRQNVPTPVSGTSVTINDTAPTGDRYNLSLVEVLASTAPPAPTYSISGTITAAAGAQVVLGGVANATTTADGLGKYSFTGVQSGGYTVTPSKAGFAFVPTSRPVTITTANVTGVDFTAAGPALLYPDLSDIIPSSGISVVGSGSTRMFEYTHLTFNGGDGPLVIQPTYSTTSGNYQGTQYLYTFSGGTWTLANQIPVVGAFVFHPEHGHFHFPFSTYGLYAVAANGGIGAPVVLSGKVGFCIADSYIYDPTLPNAGALGTLGSCADPTSLRGLDIGAVDEYDKTDAGQSVSLAGVPDGTYWFRSIVDPYDYLTESNENNNETDIKLTITGNTVQILQSVTPVLSPPPAVALTSPASGATVTGTIDLTASTPSTSGVQFMLDGQPLGGVGTSTPYNLPWITTAVPNGSHWLAVQTTDPVTGRIGTSAVTSVTVSNGPPGDTTPPTVLVTAPEAGAIVSASVALGGTAADASPVISFQFYLDGIPLGAPLTAPPFIAYWNTLSVADGPHTITASATDAVGLVGQSAPVIVTVDNSHPPDLIGKDVTISQDGTGVIQTAPFSTSNPDDWLVAFVAYDGPPNSGQSALVSGAGLSWLLLKRSNAQHGNSEIWAAKATGVLSNVSVTSQPGIGGFDGSLTVIAFTHTSGAGVVGQSSAPSGAPDIFLPGVAAGSWVFAVGNDWDSATPRTAVGGQVILHEWADAGAGDTYWVQSTTAPSTAFTLVDIRDSAPTTDQWNFAAAELVATRQGTSNTPPVAVAVGVPQIGPAPLLVRFSGATSTDANRDSLTFAWAFGDGGTAMGRLASHNYPAAGSYAAILTVDDGRGGTDTASVAISATGPPTFPQTAVLDNFNRANGAIGSNWIDQTSRFSIATNTLAPQTGDNYIEWNGASFGANQEVFITLSTAGSSSIEQNLMLKTQGSSWAAGHIEVAYTPADSKVTIYTLTSPNTWNTRGVITGVSLVAGNQFGARALSDGTVRVYKNGTMIGSVSVAGWAFAANGGRIGVSTANASASRFDNFGGGNVAAAATLDALPTVAQHTPPGDERPRQLSLSGAFPNPTTGGVALSLALPEDADVGMSVLDIQGREVWRAPTAHQSAGRWSLAWDGRGARGAASTGVYLVRVRVAGQVFLRRVALIR